MTKPTQHAEDAEDKPSTDNTKVAVPAPTPEQKLEDVYKSFKRVNRRWMGLQNQSKKGRRIRINETFKRRFQKSKKSF